MILALKKLHTLKFNQKIFITGLTFKSLPCFFVFKFFCRLFTALLSFPFCINNLDFDCLLTSPIEETNCKS